MDYAASLLKLVLQPCLGRFLQTELNVGQLGLSLSRGATLADLLLDAAALNAALRAAGAPVEVADAFVGGVRLAARGWREAPELHVDGLVVTLRPAAWGGAAPAEAGGGAEPAAEEASPVGADEGASTITQRLVSWLQLMPVRGSSVVVRFEAGGAGAPKLELSVAEWKWGGLRVDTVNDARVAKAAAYFSALAVHLLHDEAATSLLAAASDGDVELGWSSGGAQPPTLDVSGRLGVLELHLPTASVGCLVDICGRYASAAAASSAHGAPAAGMAAASPLDGGSFLVRSGNSLLAALDEEESFHDARSRMSDEAASFHSQLAAVHDLAASIVEAREPMGLRARIVAPATKLSVAYATDQGALQMELAGLEAALLRDRSDNDVTLSVSHVSAVEVLDAREGRAAVEDGLASEAHAAYLAVPSSAAERAADARAADSHFVIGQTVCAASRALASSSSAHDREMAVEQAVRVMTCGQRPETPFDNASGGALLAHAMLTSGIARGMHHASVALQPVFVWLSAACMSRIVSTAELLGQQLHGSLDKRASCPVVVHAPTPHSSSITVFMPRCMLMAMASYDVDRAAFVGIELAASARHAGVIVDYIARHQRERADGMIVRTVSRIKDVFQRIRSEEVAGLLRVEAPEFGPTCIATLSAKGASMFQIKRSTMGIMQCSYIARSTGKPRASSLGT
jgi:hypothetical protein